MTTLQRQLARHLYRWHRLLGVAAALFLLLLAVTGILLNHTTELRLAERHVSARPLLAWYGIAAPEEVRFFAAGEHHLSQWHERLLLDAIDLGAQPGTLRGAVASNGLLAVAFDERLLLLRSDGQLVDLLDAQSSLPVPLERIGLTADGLVVIATPAGTFVGDAELSQWQRSALHVQQWSEAAPPPAAVRRAAEARYLGAGLPLERVVLDLHSGRLFTRHGPWLMDLVALILIFSTLSGLWLWWRHQQRPSRR